MRKGRWSNNRGDAKEAQLHKKKSVHWLSIFIYTICLLFNEWCPRKICSATVSTPNLRKACYKCKQHQNEGWKNKDQIPISHVLGSSRPQNTKLLQLELGALPRPVQSSQEILQFLSVRQEFSLTFIHTKRQGERKAKIMKQFENSRWKVEQLLETGCVTDSLQTNHWVIKLALLQTNNLKWLLNRHWKY